MSGILEVLATASEQDKNKSAYAGTATHVPYVCSLSDSDGQADPAGQTDPARQLTEVYHS